MKTKISLIAIGALLAWSVSLGAVQAQTITNVPTVTDVTIFSAGAGDDRINVDFNRIGQNNGGTIEFSSYHAFDVDGSGLSLSQLQASTFTFDFIPEVEDNTPELDNLEIQFLGTFGQGGVNTDYGLTGVNGASGFALTLDAASVLGTTGSFSPTVGTLESQDVSFISTDSFTNQFAIFRVVDPTLAGHQWDIPNGGATLVVTTTVVPEPSSLALLAFAAIGMVARRRK